MEELKQYKPFLVQTYKDKGLTDAEANKRADITLKAAKRLGLILKTERAGAGSGR